MDTLRLAVALLLPGLMGVVWLRWRWQEPSPGRLALLLGYGFFIGLLATTLIMRLVDLIGLSQSFGLTCTLLVLLTALGIGLSRNTAYPAPRNGSGAETWHQPSLWRKLALLALGVIIAVRLGTLALEIFWRPLYPWDAWVVWAVKSKAWFELKTLVPFVDVTTWTAQQTRLYTVEAWHYPDTVPLISTWAALGLGRWDDTLVNLPWLLCAGALGLAFYGQARAWGGGALISLVFTYLLLSLPLLDTHVALAGYADLWMASVYGLAGMAFFQWVRTGSSSQGVLALILALACPAIKIEGIAWMLTFLPAWLVAMASVRVILISLILLAATFVLWFVAGGFVFEIPGIGLLSVTPNLLEIPSVGRVELLFQVDLPSIIDNFFIFDNWHLLGFTVLVVLLSAGLLFPLLGVDKRKPHLVYTTFILGGLAIWCLIFFFTSAADWASSFTALNRVFMHIVPILLFYVFICYADYARHLGGLAKSAEKAMPPLPPAAEGK